MNIKWGGSGSAHESSIELKKRKSPAGYPEADTIGSCLLYNTAPGTAGVLNKAGKETDSQIRL